MNKTTGLRNLLNHKISLMSLGGLIVLIVVVGAFSLRTSAVDPRVTLQKEQVQVSYGGREAPPPVVARLVATMDGEVAHTADRLREATSLAFSSVVHLASQGVKGKLPRDVQTLVAGVAQGGLLPPGLRTTEAAGTLVSEWGSVSVRYRPAPLGIEVVSVARKPEYGPSLIVRIPDETSVKPGAKLYVADRLQGITVPTPFAPAPEVIALGWSPERLRSLK